MKKAVVKENIEDRVSTKTPIQDQLTTLSFFSGAMGLDLGLEKEGFNILLACEYDKASRNTIVLNDHEVGLIKDIRDYTTEDILTFANIEDANLVDVIVGGPPCQAFSTAGKRRGFSDERGNVFLKFLEVIEEIRPTYFVIENVRGLMSSIFQLDEHDDISDKIPEELLKKKGSSLYYTVKRMERAGYKLNFDLYNAANFGTPQSRERIVIIGTLLPNRVKRLTPTHSDNPDFGLPAWRTLKEAFQELPKKIKHEHFTYTDSRKKYYKHLSAGQNWRNLPENLQKEGLGGAYHLGGGKTGFFRRLDWDKPSPTLVTSPSMPATDLCHPTEIRPLSVEEYKVIQQFPLDWNFGGTLNDKYRQIGNAVPVGLGRAIGREINNHHNEQFGEEINGFKYSRYRNTSYDSFMQNFELPLRNLKLPLFQN